VIIVYAFFIGPVVSFLLGVAVFSTLNVPWYLGGIQGFIIGSFFISLWYGYYVRNYNEGGFSGGVLDYWKHLLKVLLAGFALIAILLVAGALGGVDGLALSKAIGH
jgi:hypothetical protein